MTEEHIKDSFVARIWLEAGNNKKTVWRGHLRHVQSEEEKYFQNFMEMREFLGRVSGVIGPELTAQPLKDTAKLEPSEKLESGTVTNIRLKDCSKIQMPTKEQLTQAETIKAQSDPKSLQPVVGWGSKVFYSVLSTVLMFFWWLLIYSGGVVGNHS
jgi:hypothetical protein